jgi:hypothetical protein
MSLVRGEVNPLNVLGSRKLNYIPKHFSTMTLSGKSNLEKINTWIYQNLDSRYAIVKGLQVDPNNKLVEVHELGVEDAKELTMLSLSCPYLDRNIF